MDAAGVGLFFTKILSFKSSQMGGPANRPSNSGELLLEGQFPSQPRYSNRLSTDRRQAAYNLNLA
jgi:hypothetical protein